MLTRYYAAFCQEYRHSSLPEVNGVESKAD